MIPHGEDAPPEERRASRHSQPQGGPSARGSSTGRCTRRFDELLGRVVGSAYAAIEERGLERHCRELTWEGVVEVVSARGLEMEVLGEVAQDANLPGEVRLFLEETLNCYPALDISLLASARGRESSDEGREELTRTMRELLLL